MRWGSGLRWRRVAGIAILFVAVAAGLAWLGTMHWGWPGWVRADAPQLPPPEPTVYFEESSYTVTEGGTLTITVLLSSPASETVSVDYEIVGPDGSVLLAGTITFEPGQTTYTYSETVPHDSCPSGDIAVTLNLSNPRGANTALGDPSRATLTILDDDTDGLCQRCAEATDG